MINLSLGTIYCRFGAEFTLIEYLDHILPDMDGKIRKESKKIYKKQRIIFTTGAKITSKGVDLTVYLANGGKAEKISAEIMLMGVGRKPYTKGLGLDI